MGQLCFFTNPDVLNDQIQAKGYGPISDTQFRVTSLHSSNTNITPCYAVCNGQVFCQVDQTSNENNKLLNIVLKPIGVNFNNIPVKYFIYRGISKSSFFDLSDKLIEENSNVILNNIFKQAKKNKQIPNINSLGVGFTSTNQNDKLKKLDSDSIESLFINESDFHPIVVNKGDKIALFDKNCFGFEIVLDGLMFEPTLDLVRNINVVDGNILNTNNIDFGVNRANPTEFEIKAFRERVLYYIDPCAFYGSFSFKSNFLLSILNKSNFKNEVFSKFLTKNTIYLDLRSENGLSFNYYGNYVDKIKISSNQSNFTIENADTYLIETTYSTNKWPIKIIQINTIEPAQKIAKYTISFPTATNDKQLVFISHAIQRNNLSKFENVYQEGNWSKILNLNTNCITLNSVNQCISSYTKLVYVKQTKGFQLNQNIIDKEYFINNIFPIKKIADYFDTNLKDGVCTKIFQHEKYLEIIEINKDKTENKYAGMFKSGFAIDHISERIIFFAFPIEIYDHNNKKYNYPDVNKIFKNSINKKSFYNLNLEDFDLSKEIILDNFNEQKYILTLNSIKKGSKSPYSVVIVSYTKSEYTQLYNQVFESTSSINKSLHPVFLQINNINSNNIVSTSYNASFMQSDGLFDCINISSELNTNSLDGLLNSTSDAALLEANASLFQYAHRYIIEATPNTQEYKELDRALKDVREHNKELYSELLEKVFYDQDIKDYNGEVKKVKYALKLSYGDAGKATATTKGLGQIPTELYLEPKVRDKVNEKYIELSTKINNLQVYIDLINDLSKKPSYITDNYEIEVMLFPNINTKKKSLKFSELLAQNYYPVDFSKPITITFNSTEVNKWDGIPGYKVEFDDGTPSYRLAVDSNYSKRRFHLAHTLAHEMGHALFNMENPLLDFLWSELEKSYRSYLVENNTNYPYDTIPENDSLGNIIKINGFGDGHIKGNPSGHQACLVDKIVYDNMRLKFNPLILKENQKDQPSITINGISVKDLTYCSCNLDL